MRPSGIRGYAASAESDGNPRMKLPRWDGAGGMSEYLNAAGLTSLEPKEVAKRMSSGWVLVDVRRADQFEESRAKDSVNIELFQILNFNPNPRDAIKYLLTTSQGATPVDPNPEFIEEVSRVLSQPGVKGVIFTDAEGGSLDDAGGKLGPYGCSSRSLSAAYRCLTEGGLPVSKIGHLKYGLNNWFNSDLPGDGELEWLPEARTPTGGFGNSKFSEERRRKLEELPSWRRYLDVFGGLTYAEQAMRADKRKPMKKD